jgi:hypothetical protein
MGNLQWSTMECVHTVHETQYYEVSGSGSFTDELPDTHTLDSTKHAFIAIEDATEAFIVEVIAESHC